MPWSGGPERNLLHQVRSQARWSTASEVLETPDVLLTCSDCRLPLGTFNSALRLDCKLSAAEFFTRAATWFGQRRRGFTVFLPGDADADVEAECLAHGLLRLEDLHVLTTTRPLRSANPASELELEPVLDEESLQRFASVACEAYAVPPVPRELITSLFQSATPMRASGAIPWLARRSEKTLGAGMLLETGNVGGIYWLGTLPGARASGVASTLTRALVDIAFERGLECVVLQAVSGTERLYASLGFERVSCVRRFSWPFSRSALRTAR